jgi:hypothetical protein
MLRQPDRYASDDACWQACGAVVTLAVEPELPPALCFFAIKYW